MSDLFEAAAQAEREAVRLLLPRLRSDEAIQRRHLNDAMTKAFGGSDADGRWTQRASFELLEHALACGSAWKRDPGSGVIGVEKGPLIPVV
jgi:DNA-binding GntR family transcriptional regulator